MELLLVITWLTRFNVHGQNTADTSIRAAYRQAATHQLRITNNLFLLGKIWGFLKYHHPQIAAGKYNWDQELLDFLPIYLDITTDQTRDSVLVNWIKKFDPVPACTSCSTQKKAAWIAQPDRSWMSKKNFTNGLLSLLNWIKDNPIQGRRYYIGWMHADGINMPQFRNEKPYSNLFFPADGYALLALFRFWNAIEYWYPYKNGLPATWDDVLKSYIPKVVQHESSVDFNTTIQELVTTIHDSHGEARSTVTEQQWGKYYMPFTVKVLDNKLVVTSVINDSLAKLAGIERGDLVEKIDGQSVRAISDRLRKYIPASNEKAYLKDLSYYITRSVKPGVEVSVRRKTGVVDLVVNNYIPKLYPLVELNPPYFPFATDSSFCLLPKKIGYINLRNFKRQDSAALKKMIVEARSLIIDNRQNQDPRGQSGGDIIARLLLSHDNAFARFSYADTAVPGAFLLSAPTNMNLPVNDSAFRGEVLILINEHTQSSGEFLTMAFRKAPKAKTLGARTAGADGNVTNLMLPGNIYVKFSGIGVYFPDKTPTQRVGIQPDIPVPQTLQGYLTNTDEQLAAAIKYLSK